MTTGGKLKRSSRRKNKNPMKAKIQARQDSSAMKVQLKMETWAARLPRPLRKRFQKKI